MAMSIEPAVLEDEVVRLEPLREDHAVGLLAAAADPEVWRWMSVAQPCSLDEMLTWVRRGIATRVAWATVVAGEVVGSASYDDVHPEHGRVEIGHTWLARQLWGKQVAHRAALLLLTYAFDDLDLARVAFKTDSQNQRSQRAIESLGATREGVFRRHMVRPDGSSRDSVYYSIIQEEWAEMGP